jgi:hypothetical protein
MTSTTQSWPLDTETKVERTFGTSRTPGEPDGVCKGISKSKEESTCAPLPNATHSLSLTDQIMSKLDLNIIHLNPSCLINLNLF